MKFKKGDLVRNKNFPYQLLEVYLVSSYGSFQAGVAALVVKRHGSNDDVRVKYPADQFYHDTIDYIKNKKNEVKV